MRFLKSAIVKVGFMLLLHFSKGNASRISSCVGRGGEGSRPYCDLNSGPKVYWRGWLSIVKYIEFICCHYAHVCVSMRVCVCACVQ